MAADSEAIVSEARAALAGASAQDVLTWALDQFGDRVTFASSFGAEDVVVIDMLAKLDRPCAVFTLDTGRLNQETYDVMDAVRYKYGIEIDVMFPRFEAVEHLVKLNGPNLFYDSIENRKACCEVRKLEPLRRALADRAAWITGVRREQSVTRTAVTIVELDGAFGGIVKVNPLADWTNRQVWDYIEANRVPYNKLHDRNYPSIGCAPCTRAVEPGEDVRAGRWWWESPDSKECGLHRK